MRSIWNPETRQWDRRMRQLAEWYESCLNRTPIDANWGDNLGEGACAVRFAAVTAGFCVGNFQYAVTEEDAKDWY